MESQRQHPPAPTRRPTRGRVELYTGPMFSEKTTTMLAEIRKERYAGRECVVVKYAKDTRYGADARVVPHSGGDGLVTTPATATMAGVRVVAVESLGKIEMGPEEWVVGVDEGQFFPDLAAVADEWAAQGRRVVVAALDGTFDRKPFPQVASLISRAESVAKLQAVCMDCRRGDAAFTRLLLTPDDAEATPEGPRRIGGAESYHAVCRDCWKPPSASVMG